MVRGMERFDVDNGDYNAGFDVSDAFGDATALEFGVDEDRDPHTGYGGTARAYLSRAEIVRLRDYLNKFLGE